MGDLSSLSRQADRRTQQKWSAEVMTYIFLDVIQNVVEVEKHGCQLLETELRHKFLWASWENYTLIKNYHGVQWEFFLSKDLRLAVLV
ncbi:unnamed protein product [Caretta caretta]